MNVLVKGANVRAVVVRGVLMRKTLIVMAEDMGLGMGVSVWCLWMRVNRSVGRLGRRVFCPSEARAEL